MAALSTIAAISAIAASAFSVGSALTQKPPKAPPTPEVPKAPSADDTAAATEAALTRKNKGTKGYTPSTGPGVQPSGRSSTLLTGPAGLNTAAPTERKTLLGF